MSDLQLGLVAIGIAIVVAVLAYNKWQERQYRRNAEANFKRTHEDVLMGRSEGGLAQAAPRKGSRDERVEPVLQQHKAHADSKDAGVLSEAIDFIIPLEATEDVRGDALLQAAQAALGACSKAVHWEGYNETEMRWGAPRAGARYAMLRAGLQLVDRRGPVQATELGLFAGGVQEVSAGLGALAGVADTRVALDRAAELDRFCGDVDIRIAINLVGDAPFAGSRVRALAEAAGLGFDPDGKFRRRDQSGRTLYAFSSADGVPFSAEATSTLEPRGLTLELDVPRAPGGAAFEKMREFAQQLALSLDARIVDDNGRALGAAEYEAIQGQLQAVWSMMEARAIAPGSALALRLFS